MPHVPVNIKPYLVAFFFKEMEGEEINYLNFRAKAIKLAFSSSLSKFLRISLSKADIPVKLDNYRILLSVSDKREYKGSIYKIDSGKKHFLELPEEINADINDLLEDIFKISFLYYVLGHVENTPKSNVSAAIMNFIEKYELFEFGFDVTTLRRYYYREIKNNVKLSRLAKMRPSVTK